MKQPLAFAAVFLRTASFKSPTNTVSSFVLRRSYGQKTARGDPLRILFCGTDSFSEESLKALHDYSQSPNSDILSIDVVTRPDKRNGRGRTTITSPVIKAAAQERGLTVHQIDTFTGWQPPTFGKHQNERCNLIVAVSFGLLIPPRILGTAKYGGLNIHPSMLPDLRGPAPIEWALMLGRMTTGVSLQTLHPSKFDEGMILDQTPQPGLDIPKPDTITTKELETYLAPIGARMLVNGIKNRLYVPPHTPIQPKQQGMKQELIHAPKITKELRLIDFKAMTATVILRRNQACAPLHAFAVVDEPSTETLHLKFHASMRAVRDDDIPEAVLATAVGIPLGVPYAFLQQNKLPGESNEPLLVNAREGSSEKIRQIVIPELTTSGMAKMPAVRAASKAKLFCTPEVVGSFNLFRFARPLVAHDP